MLVNNLSSNIKVSFGLTALVLWVLWTLPASADDCAQVFFHGASPAFGGGVLCQPGYALAPLPGARVPAWSAEHLTAASVAAAEVTKRTGSFHVEAREPEAERATLADYDGSGFDRGHMAPVGDFGNPSEEAATFSLGNMVPQRPELNRFLWQDVESTVRRLAITHGEAWIVTGPVVPPDAARLAGCVAIPSATWKAVLTQDGLAGAYLATNTATPECRVISLAKLSTIIGFEPFPGIRDPPVLQLPDVPPRTGSAGCSSE